MTAKELYAQAKAKAAEAKAFLVGDDADFEAAEAAMNEAEALRRKADVLKTAEGFLVDSEAPERDMLFPTDTDDDWLDDPADADARPSQQDVTKSVHMLRLNQMIDNVDNPTDTIMREVYDGDYRLLIDSQTKAFSGYLRTGNADRIGSRQLWAPGDVKSMILNGMSVAEIKTTMVEGQDILGGFAVPPQIAADINKRIVGLTAVRAGGATVVQTSSNVIQWLRVDGGNDRYPGNMRGAWGGETASPSEKNMKFGLDNIAVDLYTYKASMSTSLLEDATNIVQLFNEEVADVLAIDEDEAFLIGDGANKPRGILPGSTNARSLSEVVSGNATALTVTGVKQLRRGIASQYRAAQRASWIGNSDTGADIELFQDGQGRFYFEYLDSGERFMRSAWRESEAMPDVAAGAYPLIFGDLSGYVIVERLGLAVRRYNDSNTGINKVEFHVRRRLGGDLRQPWKIAVQKVAAS